MRNVILVGLLCVALALAGCQSFKKTPTPTPDPTERAETPTSTILSPIPVTRVPSPATGSAATKISIVAVSGAKPGSTASVSVQAPPNAQCTLAFVAPLGSPTVGTSLQPKTADASGHVDWSWSIATGTVSGPGAVTVRCGDSVASTPITIG